MTTSAASAPPQLREEDVLLRVEDLTVEFRVSKSRKVHAVSNLSFDVRRGETLGVVGESGCGKSSAALAIVRLLPAQGSVTLDGVELTSLGADALRRARSRFQIVFQDPVSSINPRRKVRDVVTEPLRIWARTERGTWSNRAREALESVGLDPDVHGDRLPQQLSGGQLQRLCIARALITGPKLLIADEPVSALDVSVQAQILNLLQDLKERYQLTIVFIAHDLAVVKAVSERVAVMYLGKLCEIADAETLYTQPAHPYTRALLDSIPGIDVRSPPSKPPLSGDVPSPLEPPSGCRFRTRCPLATARCEQVEPPMRKVGVGEQYVACHHPLVS